MVLTAVSVVLLLVTGAKVDNLIPLYAIGVFTGFTMAGTGMVKYHITHHEPHWRRGVAINGSAAVLSAIVDVIFVVTKFIGAPGSSSCFCPLGVFALMRLHRQYHKESEQLEVGVAEAAEAPVLRTHAVVVFVDRLDLATARAIQYARTLSPDNLRVVHFAIDPRDAAELESEWSRLGLSRVPLDIVECPDRRLARAALELAAEITGGGTTELTILLPRRGFAGGWRRLLHDGSADRIAAAVGQLPHVNATIVPFQLTHGWRPDAPPGVDGEAGADSAGPCPARPPRGARAQGGRDDPDRRGAVAPAGPGGRPDPQRARAHPDRASPTSNASWPTTRARSCSSSRAGGGSRASSKGVAWWRRGWPEPGTASSPS